MTSVEVSPLRGLIKAIAQGTLKLRHGFLFLVALTKEPAIVIGNFRIIRRIPGGLAEIVLGVLRLFQKIMNKRTHTVGRCIGRIKVDRDGQFLHRHRYVAILEIQGPQLGMNFRAGTRVLGCGLLLGVLAPTLL